MGWRSAIVEYNSSEEHDRIYALIERYNNHCIYLGTMTIGNKNYVKLECDSNLFLNIFQQQFIVTPLENLLTTVSPYGLKMVDVIH